MDLRYFTPEEFNRCTPSCNISQMDTTLLERLDYARHLAGIPFKLSCAYRSPEYDAARGRSGTGSHTVGQAVDIFCATSAARGAMVFALVAAGFTGIGISRTFIHADIWHKKPTIWLY